MYSSLPVISQNAVEKPLAGTAPLVSVVMAVRDAESFIELAVRSVLTQTYRHLELIVVVDGGSDGTLLRLKEMATGDPRILLFQTPRSRGQAAALNSGIRAARGQYIARFDADDVMTKRRIARQVTFLGRRPHLAGAGTAIRVFGSERKFRFYPSTSSAIRARLIFESPFAHPTMIFKAEALKRFPYNESLVCGQDYELWARMAVGLKFANQTFVGVWYRSHSGQISRQRARQQVLVGEQTRFTLFKTLGLPNVTSGHVERDKLAVLVRKNFSYFAKAFDISSWVLMRELAFQALRSALRAVVSQPKPLVHQNQAK